jgi:hypothetical protein
MTSSILYCGDTDLTTAASYLAGLMTHWGWHYEYVPSHVPLSGQHLDRQHALFIFSDYPASQAAEPWQQTVVERVRDGAGLLMIGGWESFHGMGGNWDGTAIGQALPVDISDGDDRCNFAQGALLLPRDEPELWGPLPWRTQPPAIGGLNRVRPKPEARVALEAHPLKAWRDEGDHWQLVTETPLPALVVGTCGGGRTAALLTDVAPHWVGGLVDWGAARVTAQAPGGAAIEVGDLYASFLHRLLSFTARTLQ